MLYIELSSATLMMSTSQREHIRDSLRSTTRQLRETTREELRSSQRQGKRTHSESSARNVTTVSFATTPRRKQGGRASNHYLDDDNDDNDDNNDNNDNNDPIHYSTDDSLRDCDRLASLTSKLARVDHHIDFITQCLDANVIPTGLTLDISCNVIEKSQTDIASNWSTVLKDASKSLMKLTSNHYCQLKTTLKKQICEISARMYSSGDPLEDSSVPEVVKTRLHSLTANN